MVASSKDQSIRLVEVSTVKSRGVRSQFNDKLVLFKDAVSVGSVPSPGRAPTVPKSVNFAVVGVPLVVCDATIMPMFNVPMNACVVTPLTVQSKPLLP